MLRHAIPFVLLVSTGCQAINRSAEPASDGVLASLERLEANLVELRGMIADRSSADVDRAAALEASASITGLSPDTGASIEVLRQALAVHEHQRAIACENIANIEVPGYKRRRVEVRSVMATELGIRYPEIARISYVMEPGVLEATGGTLDLAIEGEGFFEIVLPSGELRYTRNGAFRQDANGQPVTAEGFILNEGFNIPPDSIEVSMTPTGEVYALMSDNGLVPQGAFRLAIFDNPSGLRAVDANQFVPTATSGDPCKILPGSNGAGNLKQGYLERSNVDLNAESIDLQLADQRIQGVKDALTGFGITIR